MDAIQAARELGKALQQDEKYLALQIAQQRNEEDEGLQDLIGSFNQLREEFNAEIRKTERSQDKIKELDAQMKDSYARVFSNPNMIAYNEARTEFQTLITFINQIIQGSAEGKNPEAIEYQESCAGSCSGCDGCG